MNTILGQKIQQTQRFLDNGSRIPVTVVAVSPNTILRHKTWEKDGYQAALIGTGSVKNPSQSVQGDIKKAQLTAAPVYSKEVRFFDEKNVLPEVGSRLLVADVLQIGDIIDVIGVSKGKGWAGAVKRHNFRGGPRTHGQSDRERAPGSLGQTTTPGRVYKGKRMAGRMGQDVVTVQNLVVADIIENNVYVAGLIPGSVRSYVTIVKKGKSQEKKFSPMRREEGFDAAKLNEAPVKEDAK